MKQPRSWQKVSKGNTTLLTLDLTNSLNLAHSGATKNIFKAINENKTLKTVYAGSSSLGLRSGTRELTDIINESSLEVLDLSNNIFHADEQFMLNNLSLKTLNLNNNPLNDSKLQSLIMAILETNFNYLSYIYQAVI